MITKEPSLRKIVRTLMVMLLATGGLIPMRAAQAADPLTGYVLSYFGGDPYSESVHLATSTDGLRWTALDANQGLAFATTGTRSVRDPYVFRKQDGTFGVLATQGWDTDSIYVWDSPNLTSFGEPRLVRLNTFGNRVWAPQAIWNPVANNYVVYWSGNVNGGPNRTYYNTTTDFRTFSAPTVLFDPGYDEIDADIQLVNGVYYLYHKGEVGKRLFVARSTSLTPGSFVAQTTTPLPPANVNVEGPTVFAANTGNRWYMYYDRFDEGGVFGLSTTTDIANPNSWTTVPASGYTLPAGVRHATVFGVTAAELARIRAAFTAIEVVSQSNNRCLDVANRSTANGADVITWDCGGGANQKWLVTPAGELRVHGNKCLDHDSAGGAGTRVTTWECGGGDHQKWTLNADGSIVSRRNGMCLDVYGGGTPPNGAPTIIWPCHGGPNQRWTRR
jgi:hypothetical protein